MFRCPDLLRINYSLRSPNVFYKLTITLLLSFVLLTFLSRKVLEDDSIVHVKTSDRYSLDKQSNKPGAYLDDVEENHEKVEDDLIDPVNPDGEALKLENNQIDPGDQDDKEPNNKEGSTEVKKHGKYYDRYELESMSNNVDKKSELGVFLQEQERRRRLVQQTCTSSDRRHSSSLYKFLFVDEVTHITYCPVAKVASTAWSLNMLKLRDINIDKEEFYKFWYKGQVKEYQKKTYLQMDIKSTKFMVVRHPLTRLVSCYKDKFFKNENDFYYNNHGKKMMRERQERALKTKTKMDPLWPTFEEFINYILKIPPLQDDVHWKSYHQLCLVCRVDYDFILRFENMEKEEKLIMQYLQQTSRLNKSETGEKKRRGGNTLIDMVCKFFSTITFETFQKLIEKYKKDFLLFDYDMMDYSTCIYRDIIL